MRGLAVSITLGAALLVHAAHAPIADACITITPHVVLPAASAAPRNTHVWVQGLAPPLYAGATFVLVRADARSTPVPLELRSWELSSSLWQLVPVAPLAERTRYEIWTVVPNRKSPFFLGVFTTGTSEDDVAPAPPNVRRAEVRPSALGCPHFVELDGSGGSDGAAEVLHAIWLSDADGAFRYHEPPAAVFVWPTQARSDLSPPVVEILHGSRAAIVAKRVGVRTVDLAGNLSIAAELTLSRR